MICHNYFRQSRLSKRSAASVSERLFTGNSGKKEVDVMEENTTTCDEYSLARDSTTTTDGASSQQQKSRLTPEEMKDKLLRLTAHWNHEVVEARLGENAVLLSKWTLLLDRDEKRGGIVTENEAKEHALVRRQLHESLGFLMKYVQLHMSMKQHEMGTSVSANANANANASASVNKRPLEEEAAVGEAVPAQQDDDIHKRAKVDAAVVDTA